MSIFDRVFGGFNKKQVTRYSVTIDKINGLEDEYRKLSSSALKEKTAFLKKELETGKSLSDILPFAFANAREGARRIIGQRAFDTQLIGGIVLHEGKIAEMKTGEGKTLTAIFPLYLNALAGKGAHLVTVNDYLAKRDAEWMGKVYHALGLSVSVIQNQGVSYVFDPDYTPEEKSDIDDSNPALIQMANLRPCSRKEAYACDITYGTNNEFGFDYLRDNMARSPEGMVQRELHFAIVDEVDSILIDEARTPLIISAPARQSASLYMEYATIARRLKPETDLTIDEKDRAVNVTDEGISKVERLTGIKDFYSTTNVHLVHHLEEALKAQFLFTRDKDYVVKNGEVIIVDEFTGRMMPGRRYSEGLHQAIEAKEGVEVQKESETLATISFQNLFRLYDKLSGMTGTAETEAEEFYKIYKLDVVVVPTNKPMVRKDKQDLIYKTVDGKYNAIAEKIDEVHKRGQPVLVGTVSIEKSEKLSKLLRQRGIKHEVLNAKHHEREAAIIAQAGRPGAVTVATNMAGRGVDIVLGGSPLNKNKRDEVMEAGGLFVLGTERHESRRIDNQLRGRSGRQGDPGESRFYISLEDDLMRIFGGERLKNMMERLGLPDDQPIENKMISRAIESAQRRVEGHNFDIRKHLVEYDDVINKHREVIYSRRRKILCLNYEKDDWLHEKILDILSDEEKGDYRKKIKQHPPEVIRQIERAVWLQVIDRNWINHLNSIEHLRTSIGLRGYGQVDPLVVYKQEAFQMFERLLGNIDNEIAETMLRLEIDGPSAPMPFERNVVEQGADKRAQQSFVPLGEERQSSTSVSRGGVSVVIREPSGGASLPVEGNASIATPAGEKIGRNDPCPCGSGKKYKKCHGR
ncbi:MAG TPA: preprotein translocase subunit SecA [bacterium]|jgi:preprotein translocase subunit SecA|nr:preprotein translocase subunit SecA [bacterium]